MQQGHAIESDAHEHHPASEADQGPQRAEGIARIVDDQVGDHRTERGKAARVRAAYEFGPLYDIRRDGTEPRLDLGIWMKGAPEAGRVSWLRIVEGVLPRSIVIGR